MPANRPTWELKFHPPVEVRAIAWPSEFALPPNCSTHCQPTSERRTGGSLVDVCARSPGIKIEIHRTTTSTRALCRIELIASCHTSMRVIQPSDKNLTWDDKRVVAKRMPTMVMNFVFWIQ